MDLSWIIRPNFDEETHEYRVDGRVVPSVTEILTGAGLAENRFSGGREIDPEVLENAAERGAFAHRAIELDCAGELDEDSLDDEIFAYVEAWRDFVADTGFLPVANEISFYNSIGDYCGTFDMVGYLGEELTVVDLKTGSIGLKPWHKYQLAAYAAIFKNKEGKWPKTKMLHLRPELKRKKYREYDFSTATAEAHYTIFAAAGLVYSAKVADQK